MACALLNYSVVRVADQGAKAAGGKLILAAPTHEVNRQLFTASIDMQIPIFGMLETALASVAR
jgi:hypothetical protein